MRIAVSLRDQTFEASKSLGILNASLGLSRSLSSQPEVSHLLIATNRELGEVAGPSRTGLAYSGLDAPAPRGMRRVLWDLWDVAKLGQRESIDWLLLPKGFAPLARWPSSRVCAYVHDDIVLEQPGRPHSARVDGERLYFGSLLYATLRKADLVVTNSAFSAERLQSVCRTRGPIVPIGLGLPDREPLPGPRRHILLLTSPHPHKLTRHALDWLSRWDETNVTRHPVVGVGALPEGASWPLRAHWSFVRRPDEVAYRKLLASASVLLYFSSYEGYGLPPREALQQNVWTLASDLPAIREALPSTCLFDNTIYEDFATRLTTSVERSRLQEPAPAISASSWSEVTSRILGEMRRVQPW